LEIRRTGGLRLVVTEDLPGPGIHTENELLDEVFHRTDIKVRYGVERGLDQAYTVGVFSKIPPPHVAKDLFSKPNNLEPEKVFELFASI